MNEEEIIRKELDEKIEINLDQDVYDSLLRIYVEANLSEVSIQVFKDYIEDGYNAVDALSSAVINEMANIALKEKLDSDDLAELSKEQDGKEE